jgi:hypothetical protein
MSNESSLPPRASRPPHKNKKSSKSRKRPGKVARFFRWSFATIGIAALICVLYIAYQVIQEADKALDNVAMPELPGNEGKVVVAKEDRAQVKPMAILLLGLDHRKETGSMNTDVIILAALNPQSDTATVVTVPRDSLLEVPGYTDTKVNEKFARFLRSARREKGLEGEAAQLDAMEQMRTFMSSYFDPTFVIPRSSISRGSSTLSTRWAACACTSTRTCGTWIARTARTSTSRRASRC